MKPVALVTGGAGFIGANFVRALLRSTDLHVLVVDKLTYAGHLASLREVDRDPRFEFVRGDICDRPMLDELLRDRQPRWVINLAAESHVDRSIDGPRAFVTTNIVGAFELLDAAYRYWGKLKSDERALFRFLHISTDEVFGSLGRSGAFSETTPYSPNSPYAATKAASDHLVRAYWETFRFPALLTNCSNNYGPFQYPEKLLPLMILNAIEGRQLPIYGDGKNVRDWLFVDDHCSALLAVLQRGAPGERYNIGGGGERANIEMVEMVCQELEELLPASKNVALKSGGHESYAALKTFVPDRPGHDRRYAIDASKMRVDLGWSPEFALSRGIKATVRWYLEHRSWCAEVQSDQYDRGRLGHAPQHGDRP